MATTKKGKYLAFLHNNLIGHKISQKSQQEISEGLYRMGLTERRLLLYIIAKSITDPTSDSEIPLKYEIRVMDVMNFISGDKEKPIYGDFYNKIRNAARNLMCTLVEYKHPEDGHEVETTWLSAKHYWEKDGIIVIRLAPELTPVLTSLRKNYTVIDLLTVGRLKSKYAIRLYEYLKSVQGLKEVIIDIEELKALLQSPIKSKFFDFNRNVLKSAIAQINTKTDIKVSHRKGNKRGRKWTHIAFDIKANTQKPQLIRQEIEIDLEEAKASAENFKKLLKAEGFDT